MLITNVSGRFTYLIVKTRRMKLNLRENGINIDDLSTVRLSSVTHTVPNVSRDTDKEQCPPPLGHSELSSPATQERLCTDRCSGDSHVHCWPQRGTAVGGLGAAEGRPWGAGRGKRQYLGLASKNRAITAARAPEPAAETETEAGRLFGVSCGRAFHAGLILKMRSRLWCLEKKWMLSLIFKAYHTHREPEPE